MTPGLLSRLNLPLISLQVLAQHVLQPWLSLEACENAEGPTLAQAIGYSLHTPGAALHKLLEVGIMPTAPALHFQDVSV